VNGTAPGSARDNAKNTSPIDFPESVEIGEKSNPTPEMEEERRNCFVTITRTKEF
jgi:superfamily I DNA/RNA helicase